MLDETPKSGVGGRVQRRNWGEYCCRKLKTCNIPFNLSFKKIVMMKKKGCIRED